MVCLIVVLGPAIPQDPSDRCTSSAAEEPLVVNVTPHQRAKANASAHYLEFSGELGQRLT